MNEQKRNQDFDRTFINPAAWRKCKECFGKKSSLRKLLEAMEPLAGNGSVRVQLEIALFHYINATREARGEMLVEWSDGIANFHKHATTMDVNKNFDAAMSCIFGPQWQSMPDPFER